MFSTGRHLWQPVGTASMAPSSGGCGQCLDVDWPPSRTVAAPGGQPFFKSDPFQLVFENAKSKYSTLGMCTSNSLEADREWLDRGERSEISNLQAGGAHVTSPMWAHSCSLDLLHKDRAHAPAQTSCKGGALQGQWSLRSALFPQECCVLHPTRVQGEVFH